MPALKTNEDLRALTKAFFLAAQRAVVESRERRSEVLERGALRISGGRIFDLAVCRAEKHALVEHCIKLLGPSVAHDEDIEALAWEYADQAILSSSLADLNKTFNAFAEAAEQWRVQLIRYLLPNQVIQLAEGTSALAVGPVSVRRTDEVAYEIEAACGDTERRRIIVSDKPGLSKVDGQTVLGMTPTCWDVTVAASPLSRKETALWMVDVAISLIRLSDVPGFSPFALVLGEPEAKSGGPLDHTSAGITVAGTTISGGAARTLGSYVFDGAAADVSKLEALARRGERIFTPAPKSVAERVQQGLGWLTRARTAHDRPERLLYFFTALEALLSRDNKSAPVTQTISRHASVLWTNDNRVRARIATEIGKLYEVRSTLVHTGKRGVSKGSVAAAEYIVESLFCRVLDAERLDMKHETFSIELAEASFGLDWPIGQPATPAGPAGAEVDDDPAPGN